MNQLITFCVDGDWDFVAQRRLEDHSVGEPRRVPGLGENVAHHEALQLSHVLLQVQDEVGMQLGKAPAMIKGEGGENKECAVVEGCKFNELGDSAGESVPCTTFRSVEFLRDSFFSRSSRCFCYTKK